MEAYMNDLIAEGIRISGHEAVVKKANEINALEIWEETIANMLEKDRKDFLQIDRFSLP